MRILMIGDVVGRPGRQTVAAVLPGLRQEHRIDLVIANAENAAGGRGLTPATAEELLASGVDVLTSGNHVWSQRELMPYLDSPAPVLRPLNYPPGTPGRGFLVRDEVAVINLVGRTFMTPVDCPFRAATNALESLAGQCRAIVVDFHGEATSEKQALGWHLDGLVSAVLGTHTHVPTADARLLPRGTAFVTDVGMVGPRDSCLGVQAEAVVQHFLSQRPARFAVADGPTVFDSVLLEVDPASGRAVSLRRLDRAFPSD